MIPIQAGQSVAAVYETTAGKGKAEVLGEVNLVTNSDNACYKIQIYTDLTDPYDPESGTAAYAAPYEFEQPIAGVQTISVPEVVFETGKQIFCCDHKQWD